MLARTVSPLYSVAEQLQVADLGVLATQGFRTIINNRPDHEAEDQPESREFAAAAKSLGISYLYFPVKGSQQAGEFISDEHVEAFERIYRQAQGPILAFCRTGTRSIILWALMETVTLGSEPVLAAATTAGYNLTSLKDRMESRNP